MLDVLTSTCGADLDDIVRPGYNLLANRQKDGTWRLALLPSNNSKRRKARVGEGSDFASALNTLLAQSP